MSDNIKRISITGGAASDYIKSMNGGGKRTRRRINREQEGGDEVTPVSSAPTPAPVTPAHAPVTPAHAPVSAPAHAAPIEGQKGGAKIIIAPKQKSRKVIIAPKHAQKPVIKQQNHKKRRLTKRLCVPITVVKNKIAKTRKYISDSQQLPIDKIRKTLIEAKLLNPASKAPEALIRKIYADFKTIE